MQWLANVSVRRPVFATVLVLVICVLGFAGYSQLGVDRFPKVDFPTVVVLTKLPGSAPEEIETEISDKIEEAVNTISGIDELRSESSEGVSQVVVTFVLEKDIDTGAQEVREKVNTILGDLPPGTETPQVMKFDADATPILYIAVNANAPIGQVTEIADKQVRRRLESVAGVGQVAVLGGTKRQVNVSLDAARLKALGLTSIDVQNAIQAANLTVPGGRIESGPDQKVLRVRGRVAQPKELADVVIREADGKRITIVDVATVEDGVEQAETTAIRDGQAAVVLSIRKQNGANSVAMADDLRARMKEIQPMLPAGYSLEVIRDNTATIRTSVHAVQEHLILGALFAGAVVLLFLGSIRSTVIAAIAIPVSIIGTFALMWMQSFSLDTITLLALALAVGIVIDDAIVVLENITRFIEEKQLSPVKAAVLATKEIGLAVLATTLSLIAVFAPIAFMSGIVGRFLKSFGMTMAFSIAVSMLVSFTLTPMLSSRWLKGARPIHEAAPKKKPLLERIVDKAYLPVERAYVAILRWVMKRRWTVVIASILTLISIVPLGAKVPKGFLPRSDDAQFEVHVRTPEGTSMESTAITAERIAREVHTMTNVTSTVTTIGDNDQKTPNFATVFVKLTDPDKRELTQLEIMERVRKEIVTRQAKDLKLDVSEVPMFAGGGTFAEIQYEIGGPDLAQLERYSNQLVERVRKIPGAVDVNSTYIAGKPELNLRIDRQKAADLGVKGADIATTLGLFVGGTEVTNYQEDGQTYSIFVRGIPTDRKDLEGLSLVTVPSTKLGSVPLLDVVTTEESSGPSNISRLNRRRQITLTANLAPGASQSVVMEKIDAEIKAMNLPPEYKTKTVGQSEEMQNTANAFLLAFALSFIFMYLVLAAQFESWLHPITILIALPLTLPFALISLLLFEQQLDIYSMLGLLVLFGVVKKNSILQIDHTNHLRKQGLEREHAIIEANRDRLRPILMTTLAFVAGMLPLAMSTGVGSAFNRATAGVIVGGQSLSLLLTLLATPVAYSLFDDLSNWLKRRFGNAEKRAAIEREIAELDAGMSGTVSSPAE